MLTSRQKNFYEDNGYLMVEDVITKDQLNKLQDITYDFIESSRQVTENDDVFDLDEGHSAENPRLTRIKLPHKQNKYFDDILKKSGLTEVLRDLLGDLLGGLYSTRCRWTVSVWILQIWMIQGPA